MEYNKKYQEMKQQKLIDGIMDSLAIPTGLREDANQEAWVALLEGKNIKSAIKKYVKKECEYVNHKQSSI